MLLNTQESPTSVGLNASDTAQTLAYIRNKLKLLQILTTSFQEEINVSIDNQTTLIHLNMS